MSLLAQAYLIERYGLRLDLEQLAQVFDCTNISLRRRISEGSLGIPTYMDGKKRYADVRDVAAYLDAKRDEARRASPLASDWCNA